MHVLVVFGDLFASLHFTKLFFDFLDVEGDRKVFIQVHCCVLG